MFSYLLNHEKLWRNFSTYASTRRWTRGSKHISYIIDTKNASMCNDCNKPAEITNCFVVTFEAHWTKYFPKCNLHLQHESVRKSSHSAACGRHLRTNDSSNASIRFARMYWSWFSRVRRFCKHVTSMYMPSTWFHRCLFTKSPLFVQVRREGNKTNGRESS